MVTWPGDPCLGRSFVLQSHSHEYRLAGFSRFVFPPSVVRLLSMSNQKTYSKSQFQKKTPHQKKPPKLDTITLIPVHKKKTKKVASFSVARPKKNPPAALDTARVPVTFSIGMKRVGCRPEKSGPGSTPVHAVMAFGSWS